jgi:hypothetical protein
MPKKEEVVDNYVKMCTNSGACDQERKTSNLGNMMVTSCTQCFHIFGWEKISEKEKIATEKPINKKPVEKEKVTEAPDPTKEQADELKKVFAGADKILKETMEMTSETAAEVTAEIEDEEFDPMAELNEPEPVKQEKGFQIISVKVKSENTVRIICGGTKLNWFIDIETDPAKVAKIKANNSILVGKFIHVEYLGIDENLNPKDPKYLSIKATA